MPSTTIASKVAHSKYRSSCLSYNKILYPTSSKVKYHQPWNKQHSILVTSRNSPFSSWNLTHPTPLHCMCGARLHALCYLHNSHDCMSFVFETLWNTDLIPVMWLPETQQYYCQKHMQLEKIPSRISLQSHQSQLICSHLILLLHFVWTLSRIVTSLVTCGALHLFMFFIEVGPTLPFMLSFPFSARAKFSSSSLPSCWFAVLEHLLVSSYT